MKTNLEDLKNAIVIFRSLNSENQDFLIDLAEVLLQSQEESVDSPVSEQ